MKWETPAYNDIRFGFEVTMYINNKLLTGCKQGA
ncbi:MAG: pyrroloquinoline quinone precursor peptide PqqA [Gammaproteobacteria bacterium]